MDLIVDGNRVDVTGDAAAGVKSVLEGLTKFLRTQGRAVVAVSIDGKSLNPSALAEHIDVPGEVKVLQVSSASIAEMADNTLNELHEALTSLPAACRDLAAVFQGASPEDGFDPFANLASIWGDIKKRENTVIGVLDLSLDTLTLQGSTLASLHNKLNEQLCEAEQALKANDFVLLGDLLEYELAPRAEQETAIVDLLHARVRDRFPKA
ncbi:MAG: hypothetical protein AMXMBFR84_45970 [Candidatus Hydrogenedentota bacterium]